MIVQRKILILLYKIHQTQFYDWHKKGQSKKKKGYVFKATVSLHSVWDLTAMQVKNSAPPNKMPLSTYISAILFIFTNVFIHFLISS